MKRLLIILLLVMMPLQSGWAAACACCAQLDKQASGQTGVHLQAASEEGDASANPCGDSSCDICHLLAAGALPSAHPDLPFPKGAQHLRGELRRYVSHIPELIPPPDRQLRA